VRGPVGSLRWGRCHVVEYGFLGTSSLGRFRNRPSFGWKRWNHHRHLPGRAPVRDPTWEKSWVKLPRSTHTFLATAEGWVYLAKIIDLSTQRLAGGTLLRTRKLSR
jgi:hypothetical protein